LNALPPLGDSRARASLHAAVAAVFFALGVGIGLWGGASGAILIRAGVDAATFGVLLTVYTGAYLSILLCRRERDSKTRISSRNAASVTR
jgi:hypothetical protein